MQGGGETAPTSPWAKWGESAAVSNGPDPVSPAPPSPWQPRGTFPNTDLTVTLLQENSAASLSSKESSLYILCGADFPGGSDGKKKNLPAMPETQVRSLGQEDCPGGGRGNPLQYSCLENPMDRGAWRATVHGVTSDTTFTPLEAVSVRHSHVCSSLQLLQLMYSPNIWSTHGANPFQGHIFPYSEKNIISHTQYIFLLDSGHEKRQFLNVYFYLLGCARS